MNSSTIIPIILFVSIVLSGCIGPDTSTSARTIEYVNVTDVIDGDTIIISSGDKIRLIGVDTPELDEPYYSEAKQYMELKVLGKTIGLEKDVSETDPYDRLLRYVWLDDQMVNEDLVLSGLAVAKSYDPDTKYQDIFNDAEALAKKEKIGLWSLSTMPSDLQIISYLDAGRYIDQFVTVEGTVVQATKIEGSGIIFLNFHDPYEGFFSVVIWEGDWANFPKSPDNLYDGKKVLVSGKIIEYKGSPEIIVDDPSQIVIVE